MRSDAVLNAEWLVASDRYGWWAILRNTLPLFVLLAVAPILADKHAYAPWLLVPLIGLFVYRMTVVMHDCTHYTLFESRALNKVMGSLLGAVSGIDFRSFSVQHWRHHRLYGDAGDPQGFHYFDLQQMTPGEFRWHVLKPLLGLNLRNTFNESVIAPRNIVRLARTGEFAIVVLIQSALLALVSGFGRHPSVAALAFVSTATFGLFFSQLRGIAEHGVVDATAQTQSVRSHAPTLLDRMFLYDVNFNYHAEHHEHPSVPSCHLLAVHRHANAPFDSESMFGTLRRLNEGTRRC